MRIGWIALGILLCTTVLPDSVRATLSYRTLRAMRGVYETGKVRPGELK